MLQFENMGADLLLISFFVALARSIELILKPLIAYVSDNCQLSLGRRKPFMLVGSTFYAIFLVILFNPPKNAKDPFFLSIWFGFSYTLFFIADTVVNIPYLALGQELTKNEDERKSLFSIFYTFQYLGVLFASAGPVVLTYLRTHTCNCTACPSLTNIIEKEACNLKCNSYCQLILNNESLSICCVFLGLFFILSIVMLSVYIKDNAVQGEQKKNILVTLNQLKRNKAFLLLLLPWIFDVTVTTVFATLLPFYIEYIINPHSYCVANQIPLNDSACNVNTWLGYSITTFFASCLVSVFIWQRIVKQLGNYTSWRLFNIISIIAFSLFIFLGKGSVYGIVFLAILCGFPAGGSFLSDLMTADVIDYDEFLSGQRNEGMYVVFTSFIPKIVSIFAQSIPLAILSCLILTSYRL